MKLSVGIKSRWKPLKHTNTFINAANGIGYAIQQEVNMRIHAVAAGTAIATGCMLGLSAMEWGIVIGCIVLVISLELVNTAIEVLCNLITTDFNSQIKIIKDVAAGAVFIAAIGSAIIGAIIFLPKIIHLIY